MAARRPARNAGLMSERGLLPIMNVRSRSRPTSSNEASVGIGVLLARSLNPAEMRRQAGALELADLLVALPLGEKDQPMAPCQFGHGFLDAGQQLAITLDELGADSLHFAAQWLVMQLGRKLRNRSVERDHIRTAAVAVRLDQFELGLAHRGFDGIAMGIETECRDRPDELLERFQEVDVGIPQGVVGIENEIQRRFVAPSGWNRHRRKIVTTTADGVNQPRCATGRTTNAPLVGLRPT